MLFVEAMSIGKASSGLSKSGKYLGAAGQKPWRRCLLTLCLSSVVSIGMGAISSPSWADPDTDLTRLEIKFFQHSYPKDTEPARLERLEKMVFGEVKTGADGDRLAKLVETVPVTEQSAAPTAQGSGTGSSGSSGDSVADQPSSRSGSRKHQAAPPPPETADSDSDVPVKTDEKYPAVTAIEQKILGKDYVGEPIDKRLGRLETKEFGKPSSSSSDLVDRVDALKQKTGIDVARVAPRGSDWSDDDDDIAVSPSSRGSSRGSGSGDSMYSSNPREDAMSFSGRNLQQDMQKAFGSRGGYGGSSAGSGSYGFGSSSLGAPSGSYGMGAGGGVPSYPSTPPAYRSSDRSAPSVVMDGSGGMGLNQQVSALEAEIFQKSWSHDPLPVRLNRLEATVFPNDKTLAEKSLPDRVANLVAKIPISTPTSNRKVARANKDDDMSDLMNMGGGLGSGMTGGMGGVPGSSISQQQPVQKSGGGLGKIISSLGSMLTGGSGMGYTGGYPMSGGALATDPSTGMLYDPSSGNLIDPNTGAVVGRRAPVYNGYGMGGMNMGGMNMGGMNMGGYGSNYGYGGGGFNNGFSPYGNRSFGPSFGFGSGGGRMGGIGGMWP